MNNTKKHKRKLNRRVVIFFTIVFLVLVGIILLIGSVINKIINSGNKEQQNTNIVMESENTVAEEVVEEKVFSKLPEWRETAVQDIKDIYGSDEKQVFLTYDDGPSEDITPQLLEILKEEEVPATFFVLGKCVKEYPDLVKQEYEAGHFIANHGYSHTYSQIYSSVDSVFDEYNRTNEEIRLAIGKPEYDSHLFRFPGGSSGGPYNDLKARAKRELAENEIASTNWNCLSSDAAGKTTVEGQYQEILDTAEDSTSLIILMHDAAGKKCTPETTRLVIKHYKELGYEFKNFYDIMNNDNIEENDEELVDGNSVVNNTANTVTNQTSNNTVNITKNSSTYSSNTSKK